MIRQRKYSPHVSKRIFSDHVLSSYEKTQRYNKRNREKYLITKRAAALRRTRRMKEQMIAAYGGHCVCCGEDTFEFLSIDHKTPESKKRDKLKLSNPLGLGLYLHLKREGWPKEDYQLLCMNCNFAKGKYKICPHQKVMENFNLC